MGKLLGHFQSHNSLRSILTPKVQSPEVYMSYPSSTMVLRKLLQTISRFGINRVVIQILGLESGHMKTNIT